MTEKQLYDLLLTTNKPVAYHHFTAEDNISPPFIIYFNTDTEYLKADDKNYHEDKKFIVDLATEKKDITTEGLIEALFYSNNIPFEKVETYIESERLFQIRYYI